MLRALTSAGVGDEVVVRSEQAGVRDTLQETSAAHLCMSQF